MSEVWSLPGYDVQALVGFGATGEVWRARDRVTGETVALRRLHPDADPAAGEALRRLAALLRSLDTPYVVRLRDVVEHEGQAVLVLDHAPGGSLAGLLARRGPLDAGEVVTIGVPLARALAAAHARGLIHGDVSPSAVLFTAEGMPLLADLGRARPAGRPAAGAAGRPDAAADVRALAALCHWMLAGTPPPAGPAGRQPLRLLAPQAPGPLVAAVEQALADDPADRPDAATFAALLRRAHPGAPVRLTGVPGPVAEPTGPVRAGRSARGRRVAARRRLPGSVLATAALTALVGVAGAAGWLSGRSVGEPVAVLARASGVPSPTAAAPDWPAVLDGLDAARAEAFRHADVTALSAVYAPGAAGLAADSRLVAQLSRAGLTAHGVRHRVRAVRVVDAGRDRARLHVVDVLAPYEVRDGARAVVRRAPARGEAPYLVDLTRTRAGWRLVRVARA